MGQTAEDIRDNIVKIADENGNCVGTGFFIENKEFCVTCHHNIWQLDDIYVEREDVDDGTGQQSKQRYHADWVEQFSDAKKDITFLKVKGADFKPLEYGRQVYAKLPVIVRGFPLDDLYNFPEGKVEAGELRHTSDRFRWKEEKIMAVDESEDKKKKWKIKPEVDVRVHAFDGKFSLGFSGAPVCYEHDWKVVGMFEAKDDTQGYIIPMSTIVDKSELDRAGKVSSPLPALDAEKMLNIANDYYNQQEYEKAIEEYNAILKDANYAKALHNKGSAYGNLGRYEEAIACYDKGIETKPNYARALINKGVALARLSRYEEAIACYDKGIEIDPKDVHAWYNRACSKVKKNDVENGLADLKKALEMDKRFIELAKTDNDFESIRDDDRFKALVK